MLGKITLENDTEAMLTDMGLWESEDGILAGLLNILHNPNSGETLSVMPFGYMEIDGAADELGAEAEHTKKLKPLPEDVVS